MSKELMLGSEPFSALDTPCILIDLDVAEKNIVRMQEKADKYGVFLRPHIKAHKIPELAHMQLRTGACGISASKISEAEAMAESGIDDIFIANQIVTETKLNRLAALSRQIKVSVGLDSLIGARMLSEVFSAAGCPMDYLIEINSGLDRCGVLPGEKAVRMFKAIRNLPSIRFKGIFTHAGHVYSKNSLKEVKNVSHHESAVMSETTKYFQEMGVPSEIVSVGATPTMKVWQGHEGVNELRPGNYIFNDVMQVSLGVAGLEDCALTVLATIISKPEPNRAIIDAGSKVFALDKGAHGNEMLKGFGMVLGKNAAIDRLSEEHGIMSIDPREDLEIGDMVHIIPNHACTVVNLFDRAYGVRSDQVVDLFRVTARGKVQ